MNDPSTGFGPRLRAHRENRGITLDALAETTKIKRSLLAELERNDVSRWPPGLYGRAFIREYAKAIGLPDDAVVEEFLRQFPQPGERQRLPPETDCTNAAGELRLALADKPTAAPRLVRVQALDALAVLALVLAVGRALALVSGIHFWTASGIIALIWYPASGALYGGGASIRRLLRRRPFRKRLSLEAQDRQTPMAQIVHRSARDSMAAIAVDAHDGHELPRASHWVH